MRLGFAAAAPHRGQCLLPKNIIAKHEGQATVARRASQKRHCGESLATEAPHIGQLRVSASITNILARIPPTAVGGSFKPNLLAVIPNYSDAPRTSLRNRTRLHARRVELFCPLCCRSDLNRPPTAVGGIPTTIKNEQRYQFGNPLLYTPTASFPNHVILKSCLL